MDSSLEPPGRKAALLTLGFQPNEFHFRHVISRTEILPWGREPGSLHGTDWLLGAFRCRLPWETVWPQMRLLSSTGTNFQRGIQLSFQQLREWIPQYWLTGESQQHTTASVPSTSSSLHLKCFPPRHMQTSFSAPPDLYQMSLLSDTFLDPLIKAILLPPQILYPFPDLFSLVALIWHPWILYYFVLLCFSLHCIGISKGEDAGLYCSVLYIQHSGQHWPSRDSQ